MRRAEHRPGSWQPVREGAGIGYGDYDEMERARYTGGDLERSWRSGGYGRHGSAYGGYGRELREREQLPQKFVGKGPRGYVRTDERIRDEVCELLTQSDDVDATDIEVSVEHGVVTLLGSVDDRGQRRAAAEAAEAARGVKDVQIQIRVRHEPARAPAPSTPHADPSSGEPAEPHRAERA